MRCRLGAIGLLFGLLSVFGSAGAGASQAPAHTVNGNWVLTTNDCFFGQCKYTFHLTQTGSTFTGGPGSGIHGSVHGSTMSISFTGVSSEDDWQCAGTVGPLLHRMQGTFQDGTGGSGTCITRWIKP